MTDTDDLLRAELDRLVPVDANPNWEAVVARSGLKQERVHHRLGAVGAFLVAAALLGLTTPLGAALAHGLDGFSNWLTGQPGTPASKTQQHEFEEANAHSWAAFPKGTQLRQLISERVGNYRVDLLGFRSGTSAFCLRVVVRGKSRATNQSCASLADLRLAGSPVRVVIVDQPVGTGKKVAWYGIDRLHSAHLQITAGIADDTVRSVTLQDNKGRHQVDATSNAFLYVARDPDVGQRVTVISARTATGEISVPFSPSPFGYGASPVTPSRAPTVAVERRLHGGRIGWLDHYEQRGQPLTALPRRVRSSLLGYRGGVPGHTKVVFGRVLSPDPDLPQRLVLTLNANHPGGPPRGICLALVSGSGAGGGCSPYPAIFANSPVSVGEMGGGSGEYVTVDGIASDDVNRLQVLFANGQRLDAPLVDNAFIVGLPRAKLPARIIAYDYQGRIVGASDPIADFESGLGGGPARGRAKQILSAVGPGGAHAELLVGGSTSGGTCTYVRHYYSPHAAGVTVGCTGPRWTGSPLRLMTDLLTPRFVYGRVRSDIATVRLRYADGSTATITPTRGYVLQAIPPKHLHAGHELIAADGVAKDGRLIAHASFRPPPRATPCSAQATAAQAAACHARNHR